MVRFTRSISGAPVKRLLIAAVLLLVIGAYFTRAYGAELPQRSIMLSDNRISASATYRLGFTIPAPEVLGSIKLQFCANDPLFGDPCVAPGGFDVTGSALNAQSGETGFTILPAGTNANTVVLTRVPALASAGGVSYTFASVVNPSSGGTYYGRLQTFSSADASGSENEHGGLAFGIDSNVQLSATVPPYLLFCAAVTIGGFDCANANGSYINFGDLSAQSTASATSQLLTATNGDNGYVISISGSPMTSGNNIINSLSSADVSRPGISQFGLNLVANTTPAVGQNPTGSGAAAPLAAYDQPDFYTFVPGDPVASTPTADDYRKLTTSYIINIDRNQPIGVYASTLTYVCLANF